MMTATEAYNESMKNIFAYVRAEIPTIESFIKAAAEEGLMSVHYPNIGKNNRVWEYLIAKLCMAGYCVEEDHSGMTISWDMAEEAE